MTQKSPTELIKAHHVVDTARFEVLSKHFGENAILIERAVYKTMRSISSNYAGGDWQFFDLSNGGFYMAPKAVSLSVRVPENGYEATMEPDAAGITACLFALSNLSSRIADENISQHFHLLRDFAVQHRDASAILAATD
jgi:Antirestriction protein